MKFKTNLLILITISITFMYVFMLNLSFTSLVVFWIFILLILMMKNKNHFISLLLILEMFSLSSIFMVSFISQLANSSMMMFVLMTLSVGEAVLGLAILVKLIRWSSSEFITSGLN